MTFRFRRARIKLYTSRNRFTNHLPAPEVLVRGICAHYAATPVHLNSGLDGQDYFAAVQAGLDKNYAPMAQLFAEIIERSLASS